ncbi:AAEL002739-PA [Aedes aegypti]|uniref:AAEL002739-PA n=1 Tax=Aedes aegypti TaxID=7159 RepID=Q17H96_AEDAE|nr:AAEL002739-PA [Aedes aegypti]
MTLFNLEQFPDVCRLCMKADSKKSHSIHDNFEAIPMKIVAFLEEVTFRTAENKAELLPKSICDPCVNYLSEFAVYRNRMALTFRFMEALVDLKQSNAKPITALFKDSKRELESLFRELSICSKPDPQVEDLLLEFESYNSVNCDALVKVEMEQGSEPDDDDGHDDVHDDLDDPDFECVDEPEDEVETKPSKKTRKKFHSKTKSSELSSDDEPLVKKKAKVKSPRSTGSTPAAQNSTTKRVGRPRIHPEGRHLEEPWSCDKCKFKTKYRVAVERHKKVHERREKRIYPCSICGEVFKTNDEMRNHGLVHPENQFVCEMCGASLKSATSLKSHMERHEDKRKYSCQYCEYAAYTKINLTAHLQIHASDNAVLKCEICGTTFRKSGHLKRHIESHSNERKYACEQCPGRFNTKNTLRNHFNRVHLGVRYPCEYCEKTFDQRIILRDHIERVHQIQCQFICDICVVTFDSQEKLDIHKQRHENPKPMECGICLTIHPTQEALAAHMCISYQDNYQCCNKDLRNHVQYNRHMLVKHGMKTNVRVKPIPGMLLGNLRGSRKRLIQCRKCDIAFPSKALKMQHMLVCNQTSREEYSNDADNGVAGRFGY